MREGYILHLELQKKYLLAVVGGFCWNWIGFFKVSGTYYVLHWRIGWQSWRQQSGKMSTFQLEWQQASQKATLKIWLSMQNSSLRRVGYTSKKENVILCSSNLLAFLFLFLFCSGFFTWETMNLSTVKFFPHPVASWAPFSVPTKEWGPNGMIEWGSSNP